MNRLKIGKYNGKDAFCKLSRVISALDRDTNRHCVAIWVRTPNTIWGTIEEKKKDWVDPHEHEDIIEHFFNMIDGEEVDVDNYGCPAEIAKELDWI